MNTESADVAVAPDPEIEQSTPCPHLQLTELLDQDDLHRLLERVQAEVERAGPDEPMPPPPTADPVDDYRGTGFDVELEDVWATLSTYIAALIPVVRRELGLEHFTVDGLAGQLTVHTSDGMFHSQTFGEVSDAGTRRIEFVYTFAPDDMDYVGGRARLYDTVDKDGFECAAETYAEVQPLDNAVLFFPSDHHHEVTRTGTAGTVPVRRFTLSGWVTGDPIEASRPDVGIDVLRDLQQRYIPRLSVPGYEIQPIPTPVHELLRSLLVLRRQDAVLEEADPDYQQGGEARLVGIDDVADDVLRALQPIHERFADVELVPSQIYGIRVYGPGQALSMHTDRPATHVVSSVLQIDQDVFEPWPVMLDLEGRRHEVYLSPGQMLLYEGASCAHGRPRPLHGRNFANVFVHYRPLDWPWDVASLTDRALRDGLIDRAGRRIGG